MAFQRPTLCCAPLAPIIGMVCGGRAALAQHPRVPRRANLCAA